MLMLMGAVFGFLMFMHTGCAFVLMFVEMLMLVFMLMCMSMLVAFFFLLLGMYMYLLMRMPMRVRMLVSMFSTHNKSSFSSG